MYYDFCRVLEREHMILPWYMSKKTMVLQWHFFAYVLLLVYLHMNVYKCTQTRTITLWAALALYRETTVTTGTVITITGHSPITTNTRPAWV